MKNVWNFLMGAVTGIALITHPKIKEVLNKVIIERVIKPKQQQ